MQAVHELSLAGGVLRLVEQAAAREGFARVSVIRLIVGKLSGIEVESLRFALEAIASGTCLAGATIEIDEPPGEAWCLVCGRPTPLAQRGEACVHCNGYQLQVTAGTEMRVVDLLVD